MTTPTMEAVTAAAAIRATDPTTGIPAQRFALAGARGHLRSSIVLVADPETASRALLVTGLDAAGFGLIEQADSASATAEFAEFEPAGQLAMVSLAFGAGAVPLIAALRRAGWHRVLALAPTGDIAAIQQAVRAGASGVLCGQPSAAFPLTPPRVHELSDREIEILALVADGRSNKTIAVDLELSALTVKSHLARISRKLGTGDRSHMVAVAMRAGVLH